MAVAEDGRPPRQGSPWRGPAWEVRRGVRGFRRAHELGDHVCVALSGGPDSLALTAASCVEFRAVSALVVDHGLQDGSAGIAARAAEAARSLGAEVRVERVRVDHTGGGPEDAARRARYAALDRMRHGRPVLLGHTRDDQAETVLLGLARGSGARSLSGMAPWRPPWGRPLLGVRAADTRGACALLGVEPWTDPHNVDPAYTRVRVRRELLPLMEEVLGGGVVDGLARTADLLRADDEALEGYAADSPVAGGEVDVGDLLSLPEAVRSRVLRLWLAAHGVTNPGRTVTAAVSALVTADAGQGRVAVGGAGDSRGAWSRLVVTRRHGKLVLASDPTVELEQG